MENQTETYEQYRQRVIEACVRLMGEHNRQFWITQCSWEEEYRELRDPDEVAQDQFDALT